MPGLTGVCFDKVKIGNNVMIMNNCLMMGRGGITLDDGAMVAANAQLIINWYAREHPRIKTIQ